MKRLSVLGFLRAISLASRPAALHVGHSPTTTSGSLLVGQLGSMQIVRGLERNAVTLTCGMPQVGHGSGSASILPLGSG